MKNDKPYILFIEDEQNLAEIIRESLESRKFMVQHKTSITEGLASFLHDAPDIIILDVMLPDGDGFELARQIRQTDTQIPIIFLTSKSLPQDVVEGFESGGSDYLKKPFSLEELVIRIKVLLSKNRNLLTDVNMLTDSVQIGKYFFHPVSARLEIAGSTIQLTAREASLLHLLVLNKNQVIDRRLLLTKIWGHHDFFTGRSLDVFITKLRKYLQQDNSVSIMNVRGIGYKLAVNS